MLTKCQECGNLLSSDAQSCPHCGKPRTAEGWPQVQQAAKISPPTKKPNGCLKSIGQLAVVAIVSVVGISFLANRGTDHDASQPTRSSTDTTILVQGKAISAEEISGVKIAVTGVSVMPSVNTMGQTFKAPEGSHYLLLEIAEQNLQHGAITTSTSELKIIGADGTKYEASSNTIYLPHAYPILGDLNPGIVKSMMVMFEVPNSVTPQNSQLQFQAGMTGDTVTVPF